MNHKIIGITQRIDFIPDSGEYRDSVDKMLTRWVSDAGYVPVTVPNILTNDTAFDQWISSISPDGIILSGGNDIGTAFDRDKTERKLLDWALRSDTPVLGICRGMQMMAVWAGADLKQTAGHVRATHELEYGGKTRRVNSYHDMVVKACPADFMITAETEAGDIEAICHNTIPFIGWMWHPERERPFCEDDTDNLRMLFG